MYKREKKKIVVMVTQTHNKQRETFLPMARQMVRGVSVASETSSLILVDSASGQKLVRMEKKCLRNE